MAGNRFTNLTDSELIDLTDQVIEAITGNEVSYGLVAGDTTTLSLDKTVFSGSVTTAASARAAALAATQTKLTKRDLLLKFLTSLTKKIYATPTVTNTMIAAAGLAPRTTSRAKVVPVQPADLVANPSANGMVSLAWKPNGNPYGVAYLIERKNADGEWEFLMETARRSFVLDGYAPGVAAWFRVRASKNGVTSLPTNEVVIYPVGSSSSLRVAA